MSEPETKPKKSKKQDTPPEIRPVHMLVYCDGSSKPNGSYSGYGVYGYLYSPAKAAKNTKHPYKSKYYFTDNGISEERSDAPIEVTHVIEVISAIDSPAASNNQAEIEAVIRSIQLALEIDNLSTLRVITDSNYVVSSFNDSMHKWSSNGWKKQDGKEVAHLEKWQLLLSLSEALTAKNITTSLTWVKGHNGDYGNEMSDLYSSIASNAARYQYETHSTTFVQDIYLSTATYAHYKDTYKDKDFIYFYKDMMFSTAQTDDTSLCFVCSPDDDREIGKRNNTSTYAVTLGVQPRFITDLRYFYRNLPRNYTAPCSLKLSKLIDRDKLRLTSLIDAAYLIRPIPTSTRNAYSLVGEDGVFLHENTVEFPFISSVNTLMETFSETITRGETDFTSAKEHTFDITDRLLQNGKITLTTADKFIDLSDLSVPGVTFNQKLLAAIGYDTPSYLALKNIEDEITDISVLLRCEPGSAYYTLYTKITLPGKVIMTLNAPNKFLVTAT